MAAVASYYEAPRGAGLLLAHCAALGRLAEERPSARRRLSQSVGSELAELLVFALAGPQRPARARR